MRTIAALFFVIAVAYAANLLGGESKTAIPGSYIIVLNENVDATLRDLHVSKLMGLKADGDSSSITNTFTIGDFIGFSAELSPEMLKYQLTHPDVKYIEVDQVVSAYANKTQQDATWGLDRIDQRLLPLEHTYTYNSTAGAGAEVYVIDTGIYTQNVDFGGRAKASFNAIVGESGEDLNGHGTHCSGTIGGAIYGVAKEVALYGVKVLNARGSGTNSGVIKGIEHVTGKKSAHPNKAIVASMSLGGYASAVLDSAMNASIAQGVVYVVAAGNDNDNACYYSPARVPLAITVGATTNVDARSSYSNWGPCVDIFAPGSSITSDWIGAPDATNTISGTSMATPHVSGVIALHLASYPEDNNPVAAKKWLQSVATKDVLTGITNGSPNLMLYSPHA